MTEKPLPPIMRAIMEDWQRTLLAVGQATKDHDEQVCIAATAMMTGSILERDDRVRTERAEAN